MGVFGSNFGEQLSHLKTAPFNLSIAKFGAKKISLNLGPKVPDLQILGPEFENTIAVFEISLLEFVFVKSVVQKIKTLKSGIKNALFEYF